MQNKSIGESDLRSLLRGLVIAQACKYGCVATIDEAARRFEAHVRGKGEIEPDLRYCNNCSLFVRCAYFNLSLTFKTCIVIF